MCSESDREVALYIEHPPHGCRMLENETTDQKRIFHHPSLKHNQLLESCMFYDQRLRVSRPRSLRAMPPKRKHEGEESEAGHSETPKLAKAQNAEDSSDKVTLDKPNHSNQARHACA